MKILLAVRHGVYYLVCPDSGQLLYIGRSQKPRMRVKDHQRRLGRSLALECIRWFSSLEEASAAELEAIRIERPPLNQRMVSSPGYLGHRPNAASRAKHSASMIEHYKDPAQRARRGDWKRGTPHSEEHKARISAALQGQVFTEARCENISKALKGKLKGVPKTPEHRAKLVAALARGRETMKQRRQHGN